jgi:hypothetical protein
VADNLRWVEEAALLNEELADLVEQVRQILVFYQ